MLYYVTVKVNTIMYGGTWRHRVQTETHEDTS